MQIAQPEITIKTLADLRTVAVNTYCRPLNWENLVLMAHFDKGRSLVVTNRGEVFQTAQPLVTTFNDFASNNYCLEAEIMAAYALAKSSHRGLVEGHHRLVPTCGIHSEDLAFYNASYLEDYVNLDKEGCVLLNFRTPHCNMHIQLPAYKGSFEKMLEAADKVSAMQLEHLHYLLHCYGVTHKCLPVQNVYRHRRVLREQSVILQERIFCWIVNRAFKSCYGQAPEDNFLKALLRALRRVFQQKF